MAAQTAALNTEIDAAENADAEKIAKSTARRASRLLHTKWSKTANLEEFAKALANKAERGAFIAWRKDEITTEDWRHLLPNARQVTPTVRPPSPS